MVEGVHHGRAEACNRGAPLHKGGGVDALVPWGEDSVAHDDDDGGGGQQGEDGEEHHLVGVDDALQGGAPGVGGGAQHGGALLVQGRVDQGDRDAQDLAGGQAADRDDGR